MMGLILALAAVADGSQDPAKPPALEPDGAFEGTLEPASTHVGPTLQQPVALKLIVEDGAWREQENGRPRPWKVTRTAARPRPRIEVEVDRTYKAEGDGFAFGGGMIDRRRGIYRLDGDTLTIVYGPWRGPPPDGLDPATGRTVTVWRRVRPKE